MSDSYIIFEIAGSAYGIRSEDVQHVEMVEHVTPVPNTVPAVDGVVYSRGQVIPAINLRVRFGLPREPVTPRSRLVYVQMHGRVVALIVDSAREFRKIPGESIRPVQKTLHGVNGTFVLGVASLKERMILLLDLSAVLTLEETAVPQNA